MSRSPLQPLSYATPRTDRRVSDTPWSWRTLLAATWLVLLIAAGVWAYWVFLDQQDLLQSVGITSISGSVGSWLLTGIVLPCAVWSACIGVIAAAVLWHWPRKRLFWLALLPAVAAGWRFGIGVLGSSTPTISALFPLLLGILQVICLICGAWVGRPIARLATALLLPPPLAAELLPFWNR